MFTCEQIKACAGKAWWGLVLSGTLVLAAPAWAQEAANHVGAKAARPISMPNPADQAEVSAPSSESLPVVAEAAPSPNPVQTPRPASGNRDTQKGQGRRLNDPEFVGEAINLNVVDGDIRDVLNYIKEQYGINFVIDKAVLTGGAPKVTVNVQDVPWNIMLDSLLRSNELGWELNGPLVRIAKAETLFLEAEKRRAEAEARKKLDENKFDTLPLYTMVIPLNYARPAGALVDSSEGTATFKGGSTESSSEAAAAAPTSSEGGILPIIQRRLSRRGSIEYDGRLNHIIVTDVKDNLEAVRQLVALLDRPAPQVEIEARIVIANRNFSRDLGVQLGALAIGSNGAGASGSTLPGSSTLTGINPLGAPTPLIQNPTNSLGANLANSVLALTTGRIGTAQISLLLSAAENKGQAKIIASPRVTALNNRPAQIESGQQIPVVTPQLGAGTTGALIFTTVFVSVPLRLSVTPQITDAGTVILRVVAENNSINTAVAINGTPAIDTQRMQSEVLVPDGGTTVIGGVLADNESEIQNRTPGLSSLPGIGNLFKRKQVTRQTNEILFFITPRIYRPDYQGNPIMDAPKADGNKPVTIFQPVPLGNPSSNSVATPAETPEGKTPAAPATPKKP